VVVSTEPGVDPDVSSDTSALKSVSPLLVFIVMLVVLLGFFWISGTLFPESTTGYLLSPAQVTGMALTYSTTPAFLVAITIFLQRKSVEVVDQLVDSGNVRRETAISCGAAGATIRPVQNIVATILGAFVGAIQVSWEPFSDGLRSPAQFIVLSLAVGNTLTWVAVAHIALRRGLASMGLSRLGRDHIEVDLLRLDALLPFGRIGALHVLVVAIAVSLSAFQSLDAEVRWDNYKFALAAGIPLGLALTFLPMIGIRRNVRRAKQIAIAKLNEAISRANRDLEPDPLRYLADLLRQREAIQNAREWPLDVTAVSRIAIYFVIPPIAWVGGALVEVLVQAAL
jgi:hypothetical protein